MDELDRTKAQTLDREFARSARVVTLLIVVMAGIHVVRATLLTPAQDFDVVAAFAFVPAQASALFDPRGVVQALRRLGEADGTIDPAILDLVDGLRGWTPLTHAFLHANFQHLVVNSVWLAAFGAAVARRLGSARFLALFAVAAIAGAAAHWLCHRYDVSPLVGASAGIAGAMGAAVRFAFAPGAPLGEGFRLARDLRAYRLPAVSLRQALHEPRALTFTLVWFASNALFGATDLPIGDSPGSVAWEAHIGGFLAGLLGFALFDPPAEPVSA